MPSHSRIRLHAKDSVFVAHAQNALQASIVDSSDDAIMGKSPDGTITVWNRGAEALYGYTAEEIVGRPVQLLIHADRPDEMEAILERIRNGERVKHYETLRVRKDGQAISVSLTVSPILDSEGVLVGISSIARDITERKRVEALMREASAYARNLIEASLDTLVTIDMDGKITDCNEATLRVTGITREMLIGTEFADYVTDAGKAREGYLETFARGFVTDYSLTIRHTTGHLTDVLCNASLYRDTHGNVLGVLAAARDVTARKSAEAQLAEQRTKERDKLADLERFQKLTVGRELKMIELKREIEDLKQQLANAIQSHSAPKAAER
jgi:PAS domain S-box-containing protein